MRFRWFGAGAALTIVVFSGCSTGAPDGSHEKVGASSQAIQGGTDDTDHTFAVGVCGGGKGQCQGICSGALILPNLVVTARHCVSVTAKEIDCTTNPTFGAQEFGDMWITTSSSMLQQTQGWHEVQQIIVPTDNHVCGNDIALLILSTQVPSAEAKPIVPGVQYSMGDVSRYAQHFEAIGFGADGPNGQSGVGSRRIKYNIPVYCIPGDDLFDCPAGSGINPNEFIGGDGTCEGDSGSSAYDTKTFLSPNPVSYGVLSRGGVSQDGTKCQGSLYTRLDKWRDLVVQTAQQASSNWTLYPKPNPDWTVYVPPPPTPDAGTTKPSGGATLGEPCKKPSDCATKACVDPGDGNLICSEVCSDSKPCPDGYECNSDIKLCVPVDAPPPAQAAPSGSSDSSGGCSVALAPSQPAPWRTVSLAALALGLAIARRRRPG